MAQVNVNKEAIYILILCLSWYVTSSCNNVVGKTLLNEFPYPITVTIMQLFSITLYSGPVLKYMGVQPRKKGDISWNYYKKYLIPLSLGKFLAVVLSHLSLWKVPVSYAHTVKATMPLFTVILSRIILREKQSLKVYMSLLPIFIGVGIASITELSFNLVGLVSALVSTCIFALLHIYSKKVMNDTGIHHLRLLHLLGKLAFVMFLPVWAIYDGFSILHDETILTRRQPSLTMFYLFLDGFLNWVQNFIAFTILSRVSPLTYSVASASKRISVIAVSLFILGNPVTPTNVFGMILAVIGVLGYNKSKYDELQFLKKAASVPLSEVISTSNGGVFHPIVFSKHSKGNPSIHMNGLANGIVRGGPAPSDVTVDSALRYFTNPLQEAPFHSLTPAFYQPLNTSHKPATNSGYVQDDCRPQIQNPNPNPTSHK